MRRFRFVLEVEVDTDRLSMMRGRSTITESGIKQIMLRAIRTMTFYGNLFTVVSSDCIEQKGVRK